MSNQFQRHYENDDYNGGTESNLCLVDIEKITKIKHTFAIIINMSGYYEMFWLNSYLQKSKQTKFIFS